MGRFTFVVASVPGLLFQEAAALDARKISSADVSWCAHGFYVDYDQSHSVCCPGQLILVNDDPTRSPERACCVGNFSPTSTSVQVWTSPSGTAVYYDYPTPTTCSTTIQVTDSSYTDQIADAATKYSIEYTSSSSIYTIGEDVATSRDSSSSTGGAGAMMTNAPIAGAALAVVGGIIMAA